MVFLLTPAGIGSSFQADENEAAEKLIKTARQLEQKPLDKDAKELAWAVNCLLWFTARPDVNVKICTNVLGDYSKIKGDYSPTITAQLTSSRMGVKKKKNEN